jgi:predicted RNA methylase
MIRPPYQIYVRGEKVKLLAPDTSSQFDVYLQLAIDDCYGLLNIYSKVKPSVIADIGANSGFFSRLCSLYFPQARIYAYEPNPDSFKWLKQNCEGTLITPFEKAVLGRGGAVLHA